MAEPAALTDNQIMEVYDILSTANPDFLKLAHIGTTGHIASQVNNVLDAEQAYQKELQSITPINLSNMEIALENAQNAFFFSIQEVMQPVQQQQIYQQVQNISQGLHPITGQAMDYVEIAGRQYLMPVTEMADTPTPLKASFTPSVQDVPPPVSDVSLNETAQTPVVEAALAPEQPEILQPATPDLSRYEIVNKLKELQEEEGNIPLETFEQGFEMLNPDYSTFFDAVNAQGGVLVNPVADQLEIALNNSDTVMNNMIAIADDPEQLTALTSMVTNDDGNTITMLNGDSEPAAPSLAEENGQAPFATTNIGGIVMPEPNSGANINGPYDNPNIESFSDTIQTQIETVAEMPTPPALQIPSSPGLAPNIDTTPPPSFEKPTQEPTGDVVLNATFTDQNQTANVNAEPALDTYTVEKGDNLWKIGREQGLTNAEIPNFVQHMTILNSDIISDADKIYPDQTFAIPSAEMLSVDASEYYKDKSAGDIQKIRESALDTQSQTAGSSHSYLSDAKIAAAPSI